jgi:hypothetical protein
MSGRDREKNYYKCSNLYGEAKSFDCAKKIAPSGSGVLEYWSTGVSVIYDFRLLIADWGHNHYFLRDSEL